MSMTREEMEALLRADRNERSAKARAAVSDLIVIFGTEGFSPQILAALAEKPGDEDDFEDVFLNEVWGHDA